MSDKTYEKGTAVGSSLYAKSNFFLVDADDVRVDEDKSLAEYITEGGGGGNTGSGLPDYTDADNGKFLQLVDGSPSWVLIEDGDEVEY